MFDMIPQQNFCDMLKSTAFRYKNHALRDQTLAAVKRLESARRWQPIVFAQAIDQVQPGAIWVDTRNKMQIEGGPATLEQIVNIYLGLVDEPFMREVV